MNFMTLWTCQYWPLNTVWTENCYLLASLSLVPFTLGIWYFYVNNIFYFLKHFKMTCRFRNLVNRDTVAVVWCCWSGICPIESPTPTIPKGFPLEDLCRITPNLEVFWKSSTKPKVWIAVAIDREIIALEWTCILLISASVPEIILRIIWHKSASQDLVSSPWRQSGV